MLSGFLFPIRDGDLGNEMAIRCVNDVHKIEHMHNGGPMRAVRSVWMPELNTTPPLRSSDQLDHVRAINPT